MHVIVEIIFRTTVSPYSNNCYENEGAKKQDQQDQRTTKVTENITKLEVNMNLIMTLIRDFFIVIDNNYKNNNNSNQKPKKKITSALLYNRS